MLHNRIPLNNAACKHKDKTPSATVSKVGSDKPIPMVETVMVNSVYLDIQYDTGCQPSLVNVTALKLLPMNCYTLGKTQINLLAFGGMGKVHIATEVVLHLNNFFPENDHSQHKPQQWFSLFHPHPRRWQRHTGSDLTSHSGKVSILLGR